MKLNIGCGRHSLKGYINLDIVELPGIDVVHDFNKYPFPFSDNSFEEILILNSIHCVGNLFKFMEEVYRISKPNAKIIIESVYFLSPINCQDPYEKTRIGYNTFDIFQIEHQPNGISYNVKADFRLLERRWIFSKNKYLSWLSFLFNIFPRFYARFTYFWFPCNSITFKLQSLKSKKTTFK